MGLLDIFGTGMDDPRTQGLLGLSGSLLANSGYSRAPVSTGQAIGQGMQGYAQNYQQAQQMQQMQAMKQMQLKKYQEEQEQRKALQEAMKGVEFKNPVAKRLAENGDIDNAMKLEESAQKLEVKAPTRNTFRQGDKEITQEYDPAAQSWKTIGEGNPWRPQEVTPTQQAQIELDRRRLALQEQQLQQGKIPAGYRATLNGDMEAIPGGPADAKAQAAAAQKATGATDVDLAIGTLRDAYDRLEKGGGITSTKNGSLGNIAAWSASSGLGQAAGKMLGTNNQSARNDIAMTRPALLGALMKATGMSAKQMDSNAELKLWLATATDPTLDVEANRRALDKIEQKYLGAGATPPPGDNKNNSDDEAMAWAKANPLDPRAIKIKKLHGVK